MQMATPGPADMSSPTFTDTFVSRAHMFSIGIEQTSGRYSVSIPVSNGMVDYEEYYEIDAETYQRFSDDAQAALAFVERCRRHELDDRLIVKPGRLRGD